MLLIPPPLLILTRIYFDISGGLPKADDDITSVHSMSFHLLDSQRRPLILEKKRQDSSDTSEDSVIDLNSDITVSKWDNNGDLNGDLGETNSRDFVNITTDTNIDTGEDNGEELLTEVTATIENIEDSKSRRWTLDSGITSRGSSVSSEPDINISHESVLEMQKYLHGKSDAVYQPYENDSLNSINTESRDIRGGNRKQRTDKKVTDLVTEEPTESRSDDLLENQALVNKGNIKNIEMEGGDIAIIAYEFYQDDDIGHHFCTSKQNHVSNKEADIDWEHVDDHEASVLAGKYLFAHGKDVEADEVTHPLSEWEIVKQTEGSHFISAEDTNGKTIQEVFEGNKEKKAEAKLASQSFVSENEIKSIESRSNTADEFSYLTSLANGHLEKDQITAKTLQECFSANISHEKNENESENLKLLTRSDAETVSEKKTIDIETQDVKILESIVSRSVEKEEDSQTSIQHKLTDLKKESLEGIKLSDQENPFEATDQVNGHINISEEEFVGSTDEDESFDLDVDRSEQIVSKRSQQYRRPSAQDNLTSEIVDQLSAKQKLNINDDGMLLHSETKEADLISSTDEDDSYDLDVDRREQIVSKRSQKYRRASAQDNLTSEMVDQLSAKQKLTANDDEMSLESKTQELVIPTDDSQTDDNFDLDVERQEKEVLTRRSSLQKPHSQEMDMSNKGLADAQQIGGWSSDDKAEMQLKENITEPIEKIDDGLQCTLDEVRETSNGFQSLESSKTQTRTGRNSNDVDEKFSEETSQPSARPQEESNLDTVDSNEQSTVPETSENTMKLSPPLLNGEITEESESELKLETVDILAVPSDNKETLPRVPFEKLSMAEKDEILKQISDVSLGKGRKERQLKANLDNKPPVSERTDDTDAALSEKSQIGGDTLDDSEAVAFISDVTDSENVKQAIVLEKQVSQTNENVDHADYTKLNSLEMKGTPESVSPFVETVNAESDSKTILEKKTIEASRVDEQQSRLQTENGAFKLKSVDSQSTENLVISKEELTLVDKIQNIKQPNKCLYEAEEVSNEGKAPSSLKSDDVERFDDTKPEVPNIINFNENIKSKMDVKCEVPEEYVSAPETINTFTDDSEITEIDKSILPETVAVTEKTEIHLKAEIVSNDKVHTIDGEMKNTSDNATTEEEEQSRQKPDEIIEDNVRITPEENVTETDVEESEITETEVEESEIKQTKRPNNLAAVLNTLTEKLSDMSEPAFDKNIEPKIASETADTIDGELSDMTQTSVDANGETKIASETADTVDSDRPQPKSRKSVVSVSETEPEVKSVETKENKLANNIIEDEKSKKDAGIDNYEIESEKNNILNDIAKSNLPELEPGKEAEIKSLVEERLSEKLTSGEKPEIKVQVDTSEIKVTEGEPITLQWKITGMYQVFELQLEDMYLMNRGRR